MAFIEVEASERQDNQRLYYLINVEQILSVLPMPGTNGQRVVVAHAMGESVINESYDKFTERLSKAGSVLFVSRLGH